MRLAAAVAAIAIALAAAVVIHQRSHSTAPAGWTCYAPSCEARSSWQTPVAVVVAISGLAVGAALMRFRR